MHQRSGTNDGTQGRTHARVGAVLRSATTAWERIKHFWLTTSWPFVRSVLCVVLGLIRWVSRGIWQLLTPFMGPVLGLVQKVSCGIWRLLRPVASAVHGVAQKVSPGIWKRLRPVVSPVHDLAQRMSRGMWKLLRPVASVVHGLARRMGAGIWSVLKPVVSSAARLAQGLWRDSLQEASGAWHKVIHNFGLSADADPAEHRASRGFLHPPPRGQVALLVLAILLAYLFYTGAVRFCYQAAWSAYSTGNAMDAMLEEMPRVYERRDADQSRHRQRSNGAFPPGDPAAAITPVPTDEQQSALLLLYLQNLDLIDADRILVDAEKEPLFKLLEATLITSNEHPFHQRPTVDLVVDVVTAMGLSIPDWYQGECDRYKQELADVLTAMLADFPGIPERFGDFQALPSGDKARLQRKWGELVAACDEHDGASFGSWHWFRLNIAGTNATVAQILHSLFTQANFQSVAALNEARAVAAPATPPTQPATAVGQTSPDQIARGLLREDVDKLERFLSKLLSQTQSLNSVKRANLAMAVVRGYEQFALLVTFCWMMLLLAIRFARRHKVENTADLVIELSRNDLIGKARGDQIARLDWMLATTWLSSRSITRLLVQTCRAQLGCEGKFTDRTHLEETARHIRGNDAASRWIIVWLSRTIPALGFLGTVHGIALALMGADALVRAVTPEAQAAAVNAVASNLGIAFTTTFIALVMGIILSWLNDRQSYQERLLVTELERELGYVLDPIGFDPAVSPLRTKSTLWGRRAARKRERIIQTFHEQFP